MLGGKKFHPEAQTNNSHSDAHNQWSRQQTTLWVLCRWHRRLKKWWKKGFEWQEWHPSRSSGALLATLSRNKSKLSFFKPDLGNLLRPNASQKDRKKRTIQGPIIRQTEKTYYSGTDHWQLLSLLRLSLSKQQQSLINHLGQIDFNYIAMLSGKSSGWDGNDLISGKNDYNRFKFCINSPFAVSFWKEEGIIGWILKKHSPYEM